MANVVRKTYGGVAFKVLTPSALAEIETENAAVRSKKAVKVQPVEPADGDELAQATEKVLKPEAMKGTGFPELAKPAAAVYTPKTFDAELAQPAAAVKPAASQKATGRSKPTEE